MPDDPFAHSIYYLRRKRAHGEEKRYWAFSFHDSIGTLLLEAHFPEIPKEVILFEPGKPDFPLLRLRAWRWFWWNGRYDVIDAGSETVLATLRRTGGIEGPDRRTMGRVGNAMPLRESLLQLLFLGFFKFFFSQGEDSSALPVDQFLVKVGRVEIGRLRRVRLPFSTKLRAGEGRDAGWLRKWITWFRSAIRKGLNSGGWLVDFSADEAGLMDRRVRLAAALLQIQIEERY